LINGQAVVVLACFYGQVFERYRRVEQAADM
jgi:hypothetical protein